MRTKLLIIPAVLFLLNEVVTAQTAVPIPGIHKVIVSNGIMLQVERASQYTLSIKTQDIDSGCVIKTIENGVLTLKLVSSLSCKGKVSIDLSCPTLKEMEIMGNADVSSHNILKEDTLLLTLRSGGKAYLDLDVKYLDVHLSEGSLLTAEGYAVDQRVYVTTSATYSCFQLEGDNVNVEASLGGKAKICADKEMTALSKTGGYISYKCNPTSKTIESKGNGIIEMSTE
jgi:hypothetical protein